MRTKKSPGLRALAKPSFRKPMKAPGPLAVHNSHDRVWHVAPYLLSAIPLYFIPSYPQYSLSVAIFRIVVGIISSYIIIEFILPKHIFNGLFDPPSSIAPTNNSSTPNGGVHVAKQHLGGSWDDKQLVVKLLDHQFGSIVVASSLGRLGEVPEQVDLSLHSDTVKAAMLYDTNIDLHSLDPSIPLKFEWNEVCSGDIEVKTTNLPNNPWQLVYGCTTINASLSQLLSLLCDDSKRQSYDKMFKSYQDHRRVGTDELAESLSGKLATLVYSGAWPVADRSFNVLSGWKPYYDEKEKCLGIIISSRSIIMSSTINPNYDENDNSKVNAGIYIAGFYIQSLKNEKDGVKGSSLGKLEQCRLSMVSHINFGGNVSAKMINYVQSSVMPDILKTIKEIAPNEPNDRSVLMKAVRDHKIKL